MLGEAHGDQLTADQPPDNRAKDRSVLALMHVSPSRLERGARFGKRALSTRSAGRRCHFQKETAQRTAPATSAGCREWVGPCRAKTRAHSHCLLAAQTTDGLNPALGYFERSKRVSIGNSFWAGGQETATNGFLNECKRVLGFAGLRLGCLRTELGGPYLIFSCC